MRTQKNIFFTSSFYLISIVAIVIIGLGVFLLFDNILSQKQCEFNKVELVGKRIDVETHYNSKKEEYDSEEHYMITVGYYPSDRLKVETFEVGFFEYHNPNPKLSVIYTRGFFTKQEYHKLIVK